jgi:hypothetical protein
MKRIDNRQRKNVLVKRDFQKGRSRPTLLVSKDRQAERDRRQSRRHKS